jgi:ABC-type nitrate/sulfonate/bicarbonate transport system permease component
MSDGDKATATGTEAHSPGGPGRLVAAVWSGLKRFAVADRTARVTSLVLLVGVWQAVGVFSRRLPTPVGTVKFLVDEWGRGYPSKNHWSAWNNQLVRNLVESLRRAGIALVLVLILGIIIGYAMGRWWRVQAYLTDLVTVGLALPAYVWALLAVMWFGFGIRAPIFVAFISALPGFILNVFQGSIGVPRELQDMSRCFGVPFRTQFRNLMLPSMASHLMAGFRLAVLGGWGAVMLVEWFGNNMGAGYRARYWYDASRLNGTMGWALVILGVIFIVDRAVLEKLDRAAHRYRADIRGFSSRAR